VDDTTLRIRAIATIVVEGEEDRRADAAAAAAADAAVGGMHAIDIIIIHPKRESKVSTYS
jgi:hypothetical protein